MSVYWIFKIRQLTDDGVIFYNKEDINGGYTSSCIGIVQDTQNNQGEGIPVPYTQKKEIQRKELVNSWYYFGVAGEIGFAVALPIAGGAILGSFIDRKIGTYPTYTLILLGTGIFLSMVNFIFTIKNILKKRT